MGESRMSQQMDPQGVSPAKADKGYDILVSITNDYYKAYISIEMHRMDCTVTTEDILSALKTKNISYGIDMDAIESIVQNPGHSKSVLIATGIPHENGKDGELTFYVDKETHVQPRMLSGGRVDFKDLDTFKTAEAGDLLVTRTLPTPGKDGMTVTAREIKAKPGKPVNFKYGKNIRLSEDGLQLIADKSGNILFDGEKISIIEVLELRKDVGPETGNIHFMGKVVIYGNVLTGYEVVSDADIEINGIVECAKIQCKGNLLINGGVQGNDNAELEVEGNLKANFMNNTHARVTGDINCDAILHCHVTCDGSIIADGKRGMIVGGDLNVRKEIRAKVLGSEMGTLTKIRLGVDSKIMDEFKEVAEQIKETQDSIMKLTQAQRMIRKQLETGTSAELSSMLDKTNSTLKQSNETLHKKQDALKELNALIDHLRDSRAMAQMIYPGVKIRIGNSFYNVKDAMQAVRIQKDEGEIRVVSY